MSGELGALKAARHRTENDEPSQDRFMQWKFRAQTLEEAKENDELVQIVDPVTGK
jgi:hypothetical protein